MLVPGIGEYTAGAILSMAYGKHEAAVDGNVLRVYARLYGIESDILKSAVRKEITTLVEKTLPARQEISMKRYGFRLRGMRTQASQV